jgi:hypothetical protein
MHIVGASLTDQAQAASVARLLVETLDVAPSRVTIGDPEAHGAPVLSVAVDAADLETARRLLDDAGARILAVSDDVPAETLDPRTSGRGPASLREARVRSTATMERAIASVRRTIAMRERRLPGMASGRAQEEACLVLDEQRLALLEGQLAALEDPGLSDTELPGILAWGHAEMLRVDQASQRARELVSEPAR